MRLSCSVYVRLQYNPCHGFRPSIDYADWFIRDLQYPRGIVRRALDCRGAQFGGTGRNMMLYRWLHMPPPDHLPF